MHFIDKKNFSDNQELPQILLHTDFKKNKVLTTFGFRYTGFHMKIKTSIPLKTSEDLLIKRLQDKKTSSEAFKELLSLYKERLYWHIRNMVKDHEDAHDVLQNTFIKIFRNIHNFKGESKLFSWMYRIATNESISFLNKRAKRNHITSEDLQQQLISNLESDVYFEGDKIQLKLQKAIASLPAKQQQVFNMKYFQELKYREMSEILETSEGALKASYHHAAKKIEEYLKTN
ncbi:RNA polymerase sigma-70 factor, ECF subfamily [Salegentibacter salinarum]|nr:RNA polymerase sigma-70 factor, ECF subfamily [Salegentibacter salinarum]